MAEKSQFHIYARSKSLPLDWQPYDVMQSTETTFAGLELATQLISHHASIFLGVIILGMNKPRPWKCRWTSSKKWKKRIKNENTANEWTNKQKLTESWSYSCLGSSLQKIESRVLIDKGALMIVHVLSGWLASSYLIRRAFLQHISWRVSVKSVINKRKSSCHFAWRNGLTIAVWMFVHPTKYGGDIGLKGFPISQKLFLSTSEYHHYYQGGRWNMPEFLKSPYNSLSKVYRFIWSCRFVFLVLNLIFPPSRFSLLSSDHSLCYLPHFAPTASIQEKKQAAKNIL